MRLLFLMNTLCIVIVNKLESEEIKQPKQNRGILDHKGLLHCKAEMAASHFESRCHSRAADNKPIFMVMDAFGMVSVESDKAKMSCHGMHLLYMGRWIQYSVERDSEREKRLIVLWFPEKIQVWHFSHTFTRKR